GETGAVVGHLAHRSPGQLVEVAADNVAHRVAAQGVPAEEDDVGRQHQCPHADAERGPAGGWVGKPERLVHVMEQDGQKYQRDVEEIPVDVLHDEWERRLATILLPGLAYGAGW